MSSPWLLVLLSAMAGGLLFGSWAEHTTACQHREHHGLSALPPVADPGPCTPPRDDTSYVGLRGYKRYFANDSLIGRPVPCTREDKICFRHNLVFNDKANVCDYIGGGHGFLCDLGPDRAEFEKGSGRLIGVCRTYQDPCPGYRMAYDGRCYRKEIVRDIICGCEAKPTRHFLEGVECRSSTATPIHIQQPEDDGHCLIPDLRFPDIERSQYFENPFAGSQGFRSVRKGIAQEQTPNLKCDRDQAYCFAQEKVWVKGYAGCYPLLKQGPCPDEHVVALDIHSAVRGRAEAKCVHVRAGCPTGYKRMVFDGKCHEDREIDIEAPGRIVWNQYGHYILIPHGADITFHPTKVNDTCEVRNHGVAPSIPGRSPDPPCGPNDEGRCDLFEVVSEPPKPEF